MRHLMAIKRVFFTMGCIYAKLCMWQQWFWAMGVFENAWCRHSRLLFRRGNGFKTTCACWKTLTVAGMGSVEAGSTSHHKTAPVPAECWKHWLLQTQQSRPKFACGKMKNAKSTHYIPLPLGWAPKRVNRLASLLCSQAPALVPKPGQK